MEPSVMPATHAVVWIDHREARLFGLSRTAANEWTLHAGDRQSHIHHKAGLGDAGKAKPDQHYFHAVAGAVKDSNEILIVGPGTARTELMSHLKAHDPKIAAKVVAVEPLDHPTDGELVNFARKFFRAADRMR
jgi:stalled ribosome rescue protein Dom34